MCSLHAAEQHVWTSCVDERYDSRESKTLDNDFRIAKDWPNVWLYCCASIWGANDGGHIDPPSVSKPAVGPAAKKIQAASLDVKHPGSVLPARQDLFNRKAKGRHPLSTAVTGDSQAISTMHVS